jgi:hypothetical protein
MIAEEDHKLAQQTGVELAKTYHHQTDLILQIALAAFQEANMKHEHEILMALRDGDQDRLDHALGLAKTFYGWPKGGK